MAALFQHAVTEHKKDAAWAILTKLAEQADKKRAKAVRAAGGDDALAKVPPLSVNDVFKAYASAIKETTGAAPHCIHATTNMTIVRSLTLLVAGAWTTSAASNEAKRVLQDEDGSAAEAVHTIAQFVQSHGLPVPSLMVNGVLTGDLDIQGMMPTISKVPTELGTGGL